MSPSVLVSIRLAANASPVYKNDTARRAMLQPGGENDDVVCLAAIHRSSRPVGFNQRSRNKQAAKNCHLAVRRNIPHHQAIAGAKARAGSPGRRDTPGRLARAGEGSLARIHGSAMRIPRAALRWDVANPGSNPVESTADLRKWLFRGNRRNPSIVFFSFSLFSGPWNRRGGSKYSGSKEESPS